MDTAKDIPAADHHGDLDAEAVNGLNLPRNEIDHRGAETVVLSPRQGFAADLQQDPLVHQDCHRPRRSTRPSPRARSSATPLLRRAPLHAVSQPQPGESDDAHRLARGLLRRSDDILDFLLALRDPG